MTYNFISIAFLIMSTGCINEINKPKWSNKSANVVIQDCVLEFTTQIEEWNATLLTPANPIKLKTSYEQNNLKVSMKDIYGVTEGNAEICLSHGIKHFYYPIAIFNKKVNPVLKDYRSPKTVNPDSSLYQQSIKYQQDDNCNLVQFSKNQYFIEKEIGLPPKVAVYEAIANKEITSYYVQPGSCVGIPIKCIYQKELKNYIIKAGPLKDKYNNLIANGTLITFEYSDPTFLNHIETQVKDGFGMLTIPARRIEGYSIKANINNIISKEIKVTH